eukprot:CAMPEP_0175128482 /NCGR_PEP_ID=MMETSP0087-20121206/4950_1 /TAXON_ID=136419 /ORGANISM="Unknown Unknown, Strain D1" /LENGTH=223 /DNA_ID=CAMNT_0016410543 /DNA_START=165 /DNA_END=833 /DNA_ORIENTATION=-
MTNVCEESRTGPLCASCAPGFSDWTNSCKPCSSVDYGLIVLSIFICGLVLLLVMGVEVIKDRYKQQDDTPNLLTLFFDYFQMIGMLAKIPQSEQVSGSWAADMMQSIKGELNQVVSYSDICYFPVQPLFQPITKVWYASQTIAWLICLIAVVKLARCQNLRQSNILKSGLMTLVFLFTPMYLEVCLDYFNCPQIGGGRRVMLSTGFDCFENEHVVVAVCAGVW